MDNGLIKLWIDDKTGKLILRANEFSVINFLSVTSEEVTFIPWKKKWGTQTVTRKIYDRKKKIKDSKDTEFILGIGWLTYLLGVFKERILSEEYDKLIKGGLYLKTYRSFPFPGLRDYQNSDILHILKYRRAICSLYTGYGKTQIIATLAHYGFTQGKKVLIVAPGSKPLDELVKRCKEVFKLEIGEGKPVGAIMTQGLMNQNRIKNKETSEGFKKELGTYDWILVDEAEYCMNTGGKYILDACSKAEVMYAFSGTADKKRGEIITFANGLSEVVLQNKDLVSYFGPSLVYRVPDTLQVDLITIKSETLENIKINGEIFNNSNNVYLEVMNEIWTNPEICKLIVRLGKTYPKLFIPINNLVSILKEWIDNYFIGVFRILLVCGEGYIYYDLSGNTEKLDLEKACEYIKNDMVDIIPSTSCGYRALDFPGLNSVFLPASNIAGVVLQAIGRVARGKQMNIISLETLSGKSIPVYSKGARERDSLVRNFYKFCKITQHTIYENELRPAN